jgi:hypothetical protein
MPPDPPAPYVAALELVRERLWPELAADFHRLQLRDCGDPDYAETDWDELRRSVFDALAHAVLDDEPRRPRPVPFDHARDLARERYWRRANTSFHVVWSRDVDRDGYVVAEWQAFEDRIVNVIAAAILAMSGDSAPLA